ncbi:DNA-binding protein [uncultured Lactobacillus sp.]|uniref:DNA-binding protein n=1 Tax=uncultured Lactobacillus sp. TaxID=153152 RepID=UPI002803DE4C|nr:DNA-binding protein [uncultured Lactobacillus sp.]
MDAIKMELPSELKDAITQTIGDALQTTVKAIKEENSFPPYMNQKMAATYLHVAPATLIKWEKHYADFPVIVVDGVKRYPKSSLNKWMQSRKRK